LNQVWNTKDTVFKKSKTKIIYAKKGDPPKPTWKKREKKANRDGWGGGPKTFFFQGKGEKKKPGGCVVLGGGGKGVLDRGKALGGEEKAPEQTKWGTNPSFQ